MLPYINSEHVSLLYYKAHSILHPVKMYQTQEIKETRVLSPVLHPGAQPWWSACIPRDLLTPVTLLSWSQDMIMPWPRPGISITLHQSWWLNLIQVQFWESQVLRTLGVWKASRGYRLERGTEGFVLFCFCYCLFSPLLLRVLFVVLHCWFVSRLIGW